MRPSESLQYWLESSLRPRLQRMAAKRRPDLPAPQVLIIAPGVRFSFGEVDLPFHTASAGKPFVAVAAARLAQQGLLSLNAPIGELAPSIDLSALPAAPGVILSRDLTLSHLLSHRIRATRPVTASARARHRVLAGPPCAPTRPPVGPGRGVGAVRGTAAPGPAR